MRDAAESEVAAAAANDESLHPTPRTARLNVEVESIAVAMPPGRCGTHEGGRQPLLGVSALRLGSPGRSGCVGYIIHYLMI